MSVKLLIVGINDASATELEAAVNNVVGGMAETQRRPWKITCRNPVLWTR